MTAIANTHTPSGVWLDLSQASRGNHWSSPCSPALPSRHRRYAQPRHHASSNGSHHRLAGAGRENSSAAHRQLRSHPLDPPMALAFKLVDAARVFRVQRPNYLRLGARREFPAQKNLDRILTVFDLATAGGLPSDEPVDALRKEPVTSEGRSLVDLLSERIIRPNAVKSAMKQSPLAPSNGKRWPHDRFRRPNLLNASDSSR